MRVRLRNDVSLGGGRARDVVEDGPGPFQRLEQSLEQRLVAEDIGWLCGRVKVCEAEDVVDQDGRQLGDGRGKPPPQLVGPLFLGLFRGGLGRGSLQGIPKTLSCQRRNAPIVLPVLERVCQADPLGLLPLPLGDIPQQRKNLEVGIGQDDVAAGEELEVQAVGAVAELELDDAVGADLGDLCDAAGLEELAQAGDELARGGGGGACEVGQVAAEARLDEDLLLAVGLCELEEEDLGVEVVDVGQAQRDEGLGELVGDDLGG